MDFSEILRKSWSIIWKYKFLWVFGILASLGGGGGSGGGGGANSNVNMNSNGSDGPERFFNQIGNTLENIPVWVWVLIAISVLVLILATLVISTVGRTALARGAWKADQDLPITFGGLFSESLPYFWRVLLLNILIGAISLVIVLALLIPAIGLTALTFGIGALCLIPLMCLMVPLFWFIGVIVELAVVSVTCEDQGVIASLSRAWELFRANLGNMLLISIILGIINAVAGFLIGLPILIVMIPLIAALAIGQGAIGGMAVAFTIGLFCLYLPVALLLGGILQSYVSTAWTLTYRRIAHLEI